MPNNLSQFWQELIRRKVTRVITVYAASAFVILELVDIIAEPLKLPEWFQTAEIIILCLGFIITVIISLLSGFKKVQAQSVFFNNFHNSDLLIKYHDERTA